MTEPTPISTSSPRLVAIGRVRPGFTTIEATYAPSSEWRIAGVEPTLDPDQLNKVRQEYLGSPDLR